MMLSDRLKGGEMRQPLMGLKNRKQTLSSKLRNDPASLAWLQVAFIEFGGGRLRKAENLGDQCGNDKDKPSIPGAAPEKLFVHENRDFRVCVFRCSEFGSDFAFCDSHLISFSI
jgi:hypothetical protein